MIENPVREHLDGLIDQLLLNVNCCIERVPEPPAELIKLIQDHPVILAKHVQALHEQRELLTELKGLILTT